MSNYDSTKDTIKHITEVRTLLSGIASLLIERGSTHDDSKLQSPEKELFDEFTPKLKELTYGSDEYRQCLREMGVALEHHYAHNQHHPEYWQNGIDDMSLLDIVEMFVDWVAAVKRHDDGDIFKSIEINTERFGLSEQLKKILINTAVELFD